MSTFTSESHRREASRDTASQSSSSQSSDVSYTSIWEICIRLTECSKNAQDAVYRAQGKVKKVIACCRRRLERFTAAPRSEVYEDGESVNSSSCFELRRQRSNNFPFQPHPRRTRTTRPATLNLTNSSGGSYQFYMDEDNNPFITTPSCVEESGSPKYTFIFTPPSQ